METKRKCCSKAKLTKEEEKIKGEQEYSGVAVNVGDDNKDNSQLVKERTRTLNNNPRNDQ